MISFLILSSLALQVSSKVCWEQAFTTNTVFINTLSGPNGNNPNTYVQFGYISAIYDDYPNVIANGLPNITADIAKEKCDALGPNFCAAVQFFECLDRPEAYWANLLTPLEYSEHNNNPQVIPAAALVEVTGYAYRRVPCPTPAPSAKPTFATKVKLYGDCTASGKVCIEGAVCVEKGPYYSQCLEDPAYTTLPSTTCHQSFTSWGCGGSLGPAACCNPFATCNAGHLCVL
jgi:hypothetical protein